MIVYSRKLIWMELKQEIRSQCISLLTAEGQMMALAACVIKE